MIFVTVGAQMPFDRLTSSVDRWAASHPTSDVVAQIGTQKAETAFLLVSEEVPGFKPQKTRLVGSKKDWPPDSPEVDYSP